MRWVLYWSLTGVCTGSHYEHNLLYFVCFWVELRHLMRPSEERASGTADFIVFCRFEQHFIVLCVNLRIVGSAECIDFYGDWAESNHLLRPSEDSWECGIDWVLEVLSNIESSYASIPGLLRVQIVLFFAGDEQHWVILCVHPSTAGSATFIVFYGFWATLSNVMRLSEDCWECRIYCLLKALSNI